jgi:hypothetical protein
MHGFRWPESGAFLATLDQRGSVPSDTEPPWGGPGVARLAPRWAALAPIR